MSKKTLAVVGSIIICLIVVIGAVVGFKTRKSKAEIEKSEISSGIVTQSESDLQNTETISKTDFSKTNKTTSETSEITSTEKTTSTTKKQTSTAKTETSKKEKPDENKGFDYSDTIKQYYYDRKQHAADLGYDISITDYFYCIKDINSDGIDELVISEYPEEKIITGLYTVCNDKVENVFLIQRHGIYQITADGYVEDHYKGVVIYTISGKDLKEVYNIDYSTEENDVYTVLDEYKKKNGMSTEYMNFDFTQYNFSD